MSNLVTAVENHLEAMQSLAEAAKSLPVKSDVARSIIVKILEGQAEIASGLTDLLVHLEQTGQIG
jgi:uncharacterized phage infection (PIP) family protein YhgE